MILYNFLLLKLLLWHRNNFIFYVKIAGTTSIFVFTKPNSIVIES